MIYRRSLTRLELSLAAAALGIAIVVLVDRALDVMELAERNAMEATLSNVTSALNTRVAHAVLRGEKVDWLKRNPFDAAGVRLPSESWSFDDVQYELAYRPRLRRHLHTDQPGGTLRFRLIPHRAGMGYLFVPAAGFQWQFVEVFPLESLQGRCFS
jgi:hypothetical protein